MTAGDALVVLARDLVSLAARTAGIPPSAEAAAIAIVMAAVVRDLARDIELASSAARGR